MQDWGGGYYPTGLTQAELIHRLAMYGVAGDSTGGRSFDLPFGGIYGLHYTTDYVTGTQTWELGEALVGQTSILDQTPNHN